MTYKIRAWSSKISNGFRMHFSSISAVWVYIQLGHQKQSTHTKWKNHNFWIIGQLIVGN